MTLLPPGDGQVQVNGRRAGRTDGPVYPEREEVGQRPVLLQGQHQWDLQRQKGGHEPACGQRYMQAPQQL